MQITLNLRGLLAQYHPPGAGRDPRPLEVEDDATIGSVLAQLGVPRELAHLVLVNGVQVPGSRVETTLLHAQDLLAIWPPLSGG